jgi:steroid delta-isomerase-like uncharacterized protein
MQENTIPELVDAVRNKKLSRRQFARTLSTMGISAIGISAIVAASSGSSLVGATLIHQENEHHDAAKHLQRHDQHIMHQAQGNTNELHKDYAEDAIVEDSMYDRPFVGRTAIMARKNVIIAAASESKIHVSNRVVHGDQVTVEWVASGIHTGDLLGLPASGCAFSIHGVTVVVRRDGKIVRESLYYDVAELRKQLVQK